MLALKALVATVLVAASPVVSQFLSNIDVAYGSSPSQQPPGAVQELTAQNNDINFQFGGDYVWLLPITTANRTIAATGFQFVHQKNSIPGEKDLAAGAGGDYRYLFPTFAAGNAVTEIKLYRTGSGVGAPPPGYNGISGDINAGRKKTFLYLVWKTG